MSSTSVLNSITLQFGDFAAETISSFQPAADLKVGFAIRLRICVCEMTDMCMQIDNVNVLCWDMIEGLPVEKVAPITFGEIAKAFEPVNVQMPEQVSFYI